MSVMIQVFVYGTLKPGERFHRPYCGDRVQVHGPAIAPGRLYHLPHLNYPAMTPESGWVHGVILGFESAQALEKLDQLEGYQRDRPPDENEYNRFDIEVFDPQTPQRSLGKVLAYYMSQQRVQGHDGILLPEGVWSERGLTIH
ncbi:gamma-glutamylcyclotransferase family protein [Sodalinema gerasimenkoae]|uniref:gamma-glutamylcyclotransferase family protein n=1 Tax=Sodalinema gerasimenkoae TaxID=2862348 RepID=UPI0018657A41|nr:gamma-glutamylcyclotransferase family protein [Sodalinema gerasimenkoae]